MGKELMLANKKIKQVQDKILSAQNTISKKTTLVMLSIFPLAVISFVVSLLLPVDMRLGFCSISGLSSVIILILISNLVIGGQRKHLSQELANELMLICQNEGWLLGSVVDVLYIQFSHNTVFRDITSILKLSPSENLPLRALQNTNSPPASPQSNQRNLKLMAIFMILPWLFLFFAGMYIEEHMEELVNPTLATPSYVISRQLEHNSNPSIADLSMSISDVHNQTGDAIMSDSGLVIICPGDTVTLNLKVNRSGHISSFELTDPESGKPLSQSYSTVGGSEVVRSAELALHIPLGASTNDNLSVPWQADMFIIEEKNIEQGNGQKTIWFDMIKPFSYSNTIALPLTTPEIRNTWIRQRTSETAFQKTASALNPKRFRYFILVSVIIAILVLVRRSFFAVVSICVLFAGVTSMFIGIVEWLGGILAIVLVGIIARYILPKSHLDVILEIISADHS